MTKIKESGLYFDVKEADYHADPCPEPSLSCSVGKLILSDSPLHAWTAHPRLNPEHVARNSQTFDLGRAAHAYVLEGKSAFEIVDAPDWRTKAAREARDEAYAAGRTPLLARQMQDIEAMASMVPIPRQHAFLGGTWYRFGGDSEVTLCWQHDGGNWRRARIDLLVDGKIYDYKTTSGSANPDKWARAAFDAGYHIQAEFYSRGVEAVTGDRPDMTFIVQENRPPYCASMCRFTPEAMELAAKQVDFMEATWDRCLETGEWPGYPAEICWLNPPPWIEAEWLNRESRESIRSDIKTRIGNISEAILQ